MGEIVTERVNVLVQIRLVDRDPVEVVIVSI